MGNHQANNFTMLLLNDFTDSDQREILYQNKMPED